MNISYNLDDYQSKQVGEVVYELPKEIKVMLIINVVLNIF